MNHPLMDVIFSENILEQINARTKMNETILSEYEIRADLSILNDIHFLFIGWGGLVIDDEVIEYLRELKAIFISTGTIDEFVKTERLRELGIRVFCSYDAYRIPVAEYCIGVILLSMKQFFRISRLTKKDHIFPSKKNIIGNYKSKLGLISLGQVSRTIINLLESYDIDIYLYSTTFKGNKINDKVINRTSLDEIFKICDVVSIHTQWSTETNGFINKGHLLSMKEHATLINTARGALISDDDIVEVASARPDLNFILDVTQVEPPSKNSVLYQLENVVLSSHIAGAYGQECERMSQVLVDDLISYIDDHVGEFKQELILTV